MDENGRAIGQFNENPILNTLVYECELPDGTIKEYAANIIAEQILDQVDHEGHYGQQIDTILKHKRNGDAVRKEQMSTKLGSKLRKTTSQVEGRHTGMDRPSHLEGACFSACR